MGKFTVDFLTVGHCVTLSLLKVVALCWGSRGYKFYKPSGCLVFMISRNIYTQGISKMLPEKREEKANFFFFASCIYLFRMTTDSTVT